MILDTQMKILRRFLALCAAVLIVCAAPASAQDGGALYKEHCASCHNRGVDRAPGFDVLRKMTPQRILEVLEFGSMVSMTHGRTTAERRALAEFASGKAEGFERMGGRDGVTPGAPKKSAPLTAEQQEILAKRGVLSPEEIHRLAGKTKAAMGSTALPGGVFELGRVPRSSTREPLRFDGGCLGFARGSLRFFEVFWRAQTDVSCVRIET